MMKHTAPTASVEPLTYRIPTASAVTGLSKTTLYKLASEGKLKMIKVAGRTLIERSELTRLLAEGQTKRAA